MPDPPKVRARPSIERLERRLERERAARQEAEQIADGVIRRLAAARDELEGRSAELEAALNAATKTVNVRRNVLNTVAHLLQTPVTGLLMDLEIAHRTDPDAVAVRRARRNARRLADTIADLVRIAQLDAGLVSVRPRVTDFAAAVADAIDHEPEAGPETVVLVEVREGPMETLADPDQLQDAIRLALVEAIKLSHGRGPVRLRLATVGGTLQLEIVHVPHDSVARALNSDDLGSVGDLAGVDVLGLRWKLCQGILAAMSGEGRYLPDHPNGPAFVLSMPALAQGL